ncbi:hypothetical protein ACFL1A_01345 [Patescibacteria group bacterium]
MRPLSTALYVFIIFAYFGLYWITIYLVQKNRINQKQLWKTIIAIVVILLVAYPAFSYDIFNYMFSAKVVLVYGKNPYLVKPLDFVGIESWLGFMRWTHLPTAYSPFWTLLSLFPYYFGLGYFLIILWNTKLLFAGFYILVIWSIEKIQLLTDKTNSTLSIAVFALNPLVIVESLVSPHNDIVMMGFSLLAVYFLYRNKINTSYLVLGLSASFKTMTMFLFPAFVFWRKKIYMLIFMFIALIVGFVRKEMFPWYFLWVIPYIALIPKKNLIYISTGISMGLLLSYAPYLFFGDYSEKMLGVRQIVTWVPIIISVFFCFLKGSVNKFLALKK